MKMIKYKKIVFLFIILLFCLNIVPLNNFVNAADIESPKLTITGGSTGTIQTGSTITYNLNYTDNVAVTAITLSKSDIILSGFTGNVYISRSGNTATVTISNVRSTTDGTKFIIIRSGTASDAQGNVANRATSNAFLMPKSITSTDTVAPLVSISAPNKTTVTNGETVEYILTASDNVRVSKISFNSNTILLNGFTANKIITRLNDTTARLTLSNVNGSEGKKYITVASGSVVDTSSNTSNSASSTSFSIVSNSNNNQISTNNNSKSIKNGVNKNSSIVVNSDSTNTDLTTIQKYGNNLPYSANTEITNFATWLKSKVDEVKEIQGNNYTSEGKIMTYYIDYYNGLTTDVNNIKLNLNIPLNIEIVEISDNGKKIENNDTSKLNTTIEWNIDKISSLQSGRISVKVRFLQDNDIANSNEISKIFYPELVTTFNDETLYSYLRQIFVDSSITKVGSFIKASGFLDTINSVRENDEITRAEFAKMLTDFGIIKLDLNDSKYKKYKDYKEIPMYAIDSVSSIQDKNIFDINEENFNPNNPIIRDEFMKMLVNVFTYISDNKIKVDKPIYIDNDILLCSDKTISQYKDYIMELTRLNILPEYSVNTNCDEYITRSQAKALLNSLVFKSNISSSNMKSYINTFKINNIKYIYNFTNIDNSKNYEYTYDSNLNQIIK